MLNFDKPFIIAEMSGNHNKSLDRAMKIVEEAAKAGVSALKLQTYTADTMTLNISTNEFFINAETSLWKGRTLYDLYEEAHTPWEWHKPILDKCKELGIIGFSTPFDFTAVDFLEELDVPIYKIASFENTDLELIAKVAKTKKPMIISTGMTTVFELAELVETARKNGCPQIILLKCTSNYPATPEGTNLLTIPHMKELFECEVGLSDHTMGIGVSLASIALGATVIERHFTLSRDEGGVDSAFSLEPCEMNQLVEEANKVKQSLGKVSYEVAEEEKKNLIYRRSLYFVEDVKAGEIITAQNMKSIRPGLGISSKYYQQLIGKTLKKNVVKGTPVSWELV